MTVDDSIENIDALQAIDRGEKLGQDTLLRLKQARLVDVADVTNMQSSGAETAGTSGSGLPSVRGTSRKVGQLSAQFLN